MSCLVVGLALLACDGSGARTASIEVSLTAAPAAFAPGATVDLIATFAGGTARIDPDVGPVTSGVAHTVGPVLADRRYTLTIERPGLPSEMRELVVPLRYRERLTELPPSPIARAHHDSATLADGRVLLVGGASAGPLFWRTAELVTQTTFTPVGDLSVGRERPRVVALPDGGALTFGGGSNEVAFELRTRVEQWDPNALAWSVRGNLVCARAGHTATRLLSGAVLIAGGRAEGGRPDERDAEIWVPGFGSRQTIGAMLHARTGHGATLLPDGRVLIAGGQDPATGEPVLAAELFDSDLDAFFAAGTVAHGRTNHAAVVLADGRVLLVGGEAGGVAIDAVETWDPMGATFTARAPMPSARDAVRAVRLAGGRVLVVGGATTDGSALDRIDEWDPLADAWRTWPLRLPAPRTGHSLSTLADGRVLLLGGEPGTGFPAPTAWLID